MIEIDPTRPPATPRDAATVVLLRDTPAGFEVFLVRRHAKSGFMGGATVFPGGKLDDQDRDPRILSRVTGRSGEETGRVLNEPDAPERALALFVAAIRETFEEAGVLLAEVSRIDAIAAERERMERGASFADVLEALDARLRLDWLVPLSRWVTPAVEPRRFDARFFLTRIPPGQTAARDARETTESHWLSPADALASDLADRILLPPPTLRTLENLSVHAAIDEALAAARARALPLVRPVFVDDDSGPSLVLPGDPAHTETERVVPGTTRFVLENGRFRSRDPRPRR